MRVNEGNSDCLVEKWEILGLKRPKIKVSVGNKTVCVGGGVHWRKLPRKNGGKWGEMGENGGKWGKMGENGGWGEIFL